MSYYRENDHILKLPSQAKIPNILITKSNDSSVYTENKTPVISVNKLNALVNSLDKDNLHLTSADKNSKDNIELKSNLKNNIDKNSDILDIDTWFDDNIQSSMKFIFIPSIDNIML